MERTADELSAGRPGLDEFLENPAMSSTATEEEIEFLKQLRFKGRQPTALYYYRELQNLRMGCVTVTRRARVTWRTMAVQGERRTGTAVGRAVVPGAAARESRYSSFVVNGEHRDCVPRQLSWLAMTKRRLHFPSSWAP